MKTSARNQFSGKIASVTKGAINALVVLQLEGGEKITSVITNESVDRLGLKEGVCATALVKSSWMILSPECDLKLSARNTLSGNVREIRKGAVNAEIIIELKSGENVSVMITLDSHEKLGLEKGKPASVYFKASSVIIGVN